MAYNPAEVEEKWTRYWSEHHLFDVRTNPECPVFSIALPPPNVTGNLHLGHALNGTLQDILIRWKRMQGYNVLWQPGTDHASISIHMVVERELRKQGKTRHDIGREAFVEKVWEWCRKYGAQILNQYRRLGVSFNWDRIAFTMDDYYVKAVTRVFVTLFKEGFLYRGNRVTNWCIQCQTSVSDLEVEHIESQGSMYYTKYPVKDSSGNVIVATTRPETMFGDVAVAVHPDDNRYRHLVGKSVLIPLTDRAIKVIADEYVDQEFGSGALKITSAHDIDDWEVCQRHDLPLISVIDTHGRLLDNEYVPAQFRGADRFEARKQIIEELQAKELLAEVKEHVHGVSHCERCHTVIEYLPTDQWFVNMKNLAQPAIQVVEEQRITFVPARYADSYLDWMRHVRDWCISRQLWFGQRIPVWSCQKCGLVDAFEEAPSACSKCGATGDKDWQQDPDVLDTWFSSALWPFVTLGWPEKTKEMQLYYPTSVLSTARDIISLWVARMIFMSLKFCRTIPFKQVLVHPVIQTPDGRRMSKSKGNTIDPLDMIDKYGADANRFWYASLGIKGDQDVRFRDDKLQEYKRFTNKLWNAGQFVLDQLKDHQDAVLDRKTFTLPDRWILHEFNKLLRDAHAALRNYDFDNLCRQIYQFTWDYLCDWYLEIAKIQIANPQTAAQTKEILKHIFEALMRLLHPIMPFISEELWQQLPRSPQLSAVESIMFAAFPREDASHFDEACAADMELLMRTIRAIRNIRQTYSIAASATATVLIACKEAKERSCLQENEEYIRKLARLSDLKIDTEVPVPPLCASDSVYSSKIYMPLSALIDPQKSKDKLMQRKSAVAKAAARTHETLEGAEFKFKAPRDRIELLESQLAELNEQMQSIDAQLKVLERA